LIDSTDNFFVNERNKSIGFAVADAGYDVWLANTRGNKYSTDHKWLDSERDLEYWEYGASLDIAKHDYPAFINFVKNYTKVSKLSIISHS
jgi:lysosomal acid lipase/cholesteryl ester hydrolase